MSVNRLVAAQLLSRSAGDPKTPMKVIQHCAQVLRVPVSNCGGKKPGLYFDGRGNPVHVLAARRPKK